MYMSNFLVIPFLINAVTCSVETLNIITKVHDYLVHPDQGFKLCCKDGKLVYFDSKIYLTSTPTHGSPIIQARYSTDVHFYNFLTRFTNQKCLATDPDTPIPTAPWIPNIKNSQAYNWYRTGYNNAIKNYIPSNIFISYFGCCIKNVKLADLEKMDSFMVTFRFDRNNSFSLKCPGTSKLLVHSAVVRGDQVCNWGLPVSITKEVKALCDGNQRCSSNIFKYTGDIPSCNGQYKTALINASCVKGV